MTINEAELRLIFEIRAARWASAVQETGAHALGKVRARLLLWRSGRGINSSVIEVHRAPPELSSAIWRMNESYGQIMAIEPGRVNIPAPVSPGLAKEIKPGVDTAGLYVWEGFVTPSSDEWSGLFWHASGSTKPIRVWNGEYTVYWAQPASDDEIRAMIKNQKRDSCALSGGTEP